MPSERNPYGVSVDDLMEELGFDPGLQRSNFLPYNKDAGWHIPELLYQPTRAVVTAGAAAKGVPVSPEEAFNVAGTAQLGAFGGGGGQAAMGTVIPFPGKKKPPTLEHLENIKESLTTRLHKGELTWEEWLDAMDPISRQMGALEKTAREKAGLGKIQPIWGEMNQIPEGTNIMATHGASFRDPVKAKVVGGKWVQFESGMQYVPLAEFPDGKRRFLTPSNIHDVMTPTLASSNPNPQLSPRRLNLLFDPQNGVGNTSLNMEVDRRGRTEYMRPSEFLGMAWPLQPGQLEKDSSTKFLTDALKKGRKFANPFLEIGSSKFHGGKPGVFGHEGRHRTSVLQQKYGDDVHIPVHMLSYGAKDKINIDYAKNTPKEQIIPEATRVVQTMVKDIRQRMKEAPDEYPKLRREQLAEWEDVARQLGITIED
jgi:hypothetical protein